MTKIFTVIFISTFLFISTQAFSNNEVKNEKAYNAEKIMENGKWNNKKRYRKGSLQRYELMAEAEFLISSLSLSEEHSKMIMDYFKLREQQGFFVNSEGAIHDFYDLEYRLIERMLQLDKDRSKILRKYYESKIINEIYAYKENEKLRAKKRDFIDLNKMLKKEYKGMEKSGDLREEMDNYQEKELNYRDTEYGQGTIIEIPKKKEAH